MAVLTRRIAELKAPSVTTARLRVLPSPNGIHEELRTPRNPWKSADLTVEFPQPDRLVFHSPSRFASWRSALCREFIEQSFGAPEVCEVEIDIVARNATVIFKANGNLKAVLTKIAQVYQGKHEPETRPELPPDLLRAVPKNLPRLRLFRYGGTISTWERRLEMPGWIRFRNALVLNKRYLVKLIERELLGLIGIEQYKLHRNAGSISIAFNPRAIHPEQIVRHLDKALSKAPARPPKERLELDFPIASTSLAISAAATFFMP